MSVGLILITLFLVPLFFGIPIAFALGIMVLAACLFIPSVTTDMMIQTFFTACDSFPLLAIPFFILAGEIMLRGGLSGRIINFTMAFIGNKAGSLGIATTLACMIFAAISGSGPATVAAIGGLMVPAMIKDKYDEAFACSLAATAGAMGPIIPPSILFIVYGVMASQSVTELFMAGIVPGILMAVALSIFTYIVAKKYKFGTISHDRISVKDKLKALNEAKWALLVPVIILGGIYGGLVTPTEAGVIACNYALIISFLVYKEINVKDLIPIFVNTCRTTGYCMVFVGAATMLGRILALENIPQQLADAIYGFSTNKIVIFLLINFILLIVGCFMEPVAAIIILGPLLVPIATGIGIDPIHFGVVMVVNLTIGMCTPPVGINMFVGAGLRNLAPEKMFKWLFPCIGILILVLLLLVFIPPLSTGLSDLLM